MIGSSTKLVANYSDLEVYKKAFLVSLSIHRASLDFPKHEQFALTSQMRRASKSICANLAEGFVKQQSSKAEFKRFLLIAMGSATEMQVWIDYARELGYALPKIAQDWKSEYVLILRMLQKLYNNI